MEEHWEGDIQVDFIKIHSLPRTLAYEMPQQLIAPTIVPYVWCEIMKADRSTLLLAHAELLSLAEQPFSEAFPSLRVNIGSVEWTERGERVEIVGAG